MTDSNQKQLSNTLWEIADCLNTFDTLIIDAPKARKPQDP